MASGHASYGACPRSGKIPPGHAGGQPTLPLGNPRLPLALHGVEERVFAMPGEVVSAAGHWPAKELALEVL